MKQTALVLFSFTVLLVACHPGATEGDISLLHVKNYDRNHLLKSGYVSHNLSVPKRDSDGRVNIESFFAPDTVQNEPNLSDRFWGLLTQEPDIPHFFSCSKGDTLSMIFFFSDKPSNYTVEISYNNTEDAKKAFNNWANGKIPGFTPIGLIASDSNTLIVRDEVLRLYKEVRLLSNHKIFVYHPIPRYE